MFDFYISYFSKKLFCKILYESLAEVICFSDRNSDLFSLEFLKNSDRKSSEVIYLISSFGCFLTFPVRILQMAEEFFEKSEQNLVRILVGKENGFS